MFYRSVSRPIFQVKTWYQAKGLVIGYQYGPEAKGMRSNHHVQRAQPFTDPLEFRTHGSVSVCHLAVPREDVHSQEKLRYSGAQELTRRPAAETKHDFAFSHGRNAKCTRSGF